MSTPAWQAGGAHQHPSAFSRSSLEPHWATFDLRSVAWPDPAVVGFIDGPG